MIEVTRLNGSPLLLNSDLIQFADSAPDTILTLIHGEKLLVRETRAQLAERIIEFRAKLLCAAHGLDASLATAQAADTAARIARVTAKTPGEEE